RATKRLPGARPCDEHEWERAARGADDRPYTAGDDLLPDDANVDVTYGMDPIARGPDEVGSHPASDSLFGVRDLHGNAIELVASARASYAAVGRGGGWYYDRRVSARTYLHFEEDATTRTATTGLRVCADLAGEGTP